MGDKPLRISLCRGEASVSVGTRKHKLLQDFSSWISPRRESPLAEELWRLLPAHSSPGTSEFEPAYGFNDETAAGLLGRASPAAPQLSLGVTRTVTASENPWDLVLIVTRMAPNVGCFFFRQHLHSPVSLIM